jgi:hypothetical protein
MRNDFHLNKFNFQSQLSISEKKMPQILSDNRQMSIPPLPQPKQRPKRISLDIRDLISDESTLSEGEDEAPLSLEEAYERGIENLKKVEHLEKVIPHLMQRLFNEDEYLEQLMICYLAETDPESASESFPPFFDKRILSTAPTQKANEDLTTST